MDDCIFCKIVRKEFETKFLHEDDDFVVFNDIHPKAPVHLLIVPKRHIDSINHLEEQDENLAGKMLLLAKKMAEKSGVAEKGYKLILNVGKEGGQSVSHLHLHLLGGRSLPESEV